MVGAIVEGGSTTIVKVQNAREDGGGKEKRCVFFLFL